MAEEKHHHQHHQLFHHKKGEEMAVGEEVIAYNSETTTYGGGDAAGYGNTVGYGSYSEEKIGPDGGYSISSYSEEMIGPDGGYGRYSEETKGPDGGYSRYSEGPIGPGCGHGAVMGSGGDYEKHVKQHKHREHPGEVGAFALYEKHESKKSPGHAHKVEEEIAAAVEVVPGGYAYHKSSTKIETTQSSSTTSYSH